MFLFLIARTTEFVSHGRFLFVLISRSRKRFQERSRKRFRERSLKRFRERSRAVYGNTIFVAKLLYFFLLTKIHSKYNSYY